MPNVARNCFCAPANTFLNSSPFVPGTKPRQWAPKRNWLLSMRTFLPDAVLSDDCPRVLAREGIAHEVLDELACLVSLPNIFHMLIAVVVDVIGGLRRLLLHLLILVLVYGLPVSSISLQSHFDH
jgi:hypothetical protein